MPIEVWKMGWNWGAFLMSWIWGLGNRTYIALLFFVPFGWVVMPFVLGAKGTEWAWRNKRWESVERFKRAQRRWMVAGILVWGLLLALIVWALVAYVGARSGRTSGPTRNPTLPAGYSLEKDVPDGFAIALPPTWDSTTEPAGEETRKFVAADTRSTSDVPPQVRVGRVEVPATAGVDRFAGATLAALSEYESFVLKSRRSVHLPSGDAVEVEFEVRDDKGALGHHIAFFEVHNGYGYFIDFVAAPEEAAAQLARFRLMAESFRFLS